MYMKYAYLTLGGVKESLGDAEGPEAGGYTTDPWSHANHINFIIAYVCNKV